MEVGGRERRSVGRGQREVNGGGKGGRERRSVGRGKREVNGGGKGGWEGEREGA